MLLILRVHFRQIVVLDNWEGLQWDEGALGDMLDHDNRVVAHSQLGVGGTDEDLELQLVLVLLADRLLFLHPARLSQSVNHLGQYDTNNEFIRAVGI